MAKYFGKPCLKHPDLNGERYSHTSNCVKCAIDAVSAWKTRNKEKVLASARVSYGKNLEKEKEKNRRKRINGSAKKAYNKWSKENKSKLGSKCAKKRALKLCATPLWANKKAIEDFYITANMLGMHTGDHYHVDHIIPLKSKFVCGLHCEQNLQVLTRAENLLKGNRFKPC